MVVLEDQLHNFLVTSQILVEHRELHREQEHVSLIQKMFEHGDPVFRSVLQKNQKFLDDFDNISKPVIAKIHGFCIGGGLIMALCCDFRIASEKSVFVLPELKRGIGVIMGTKRVVDTIGIARTNEMILKVKKVNTN